MRDLRIKCASGDNDRLTFSTNTLGLLSSVDPVHVVIRDVYNGSVLWLTAGQTKRLAEWLNQSLGSTSSPEPEEI